MTKIEIECWECGKIHIVSADGPHTRVFCEECKKQHNTEQNKRMKQYLQLKTELMWERAIKTIEKSQTNICELKKAAEAVLEYAIEHTDYFASQHEMIAAIILIDNAVKVGMQKKIGRHRVDFLIEEYKIILEIDGYMHDYHKVKDCKRDQELRQELGSEWEVIRIPTKYLEENPGQLVKAMIELKKYKQQLRKQNEGIIRDWYSDREKRRYIKEIGTAEDKQIQKEIDYQKELSKA